MRIAIAQFNPVVGDLQGNARRMVATMEAARARGAHLVIFPEMSLMGYPPRDLLLIPEFIREAQEVLEQVLAPAAQGIAALVGTALPGGDLQPRLYNAAVLLAGGRVAAVQAKSCLPTYDVFDEARYFLPASRREPMALGGLRLAVTVCEDIWNDKEFWRDIRYPVDPVAELAARGVDAIINISASPWNLGKQTLRLEMVRALARRYGVPVVYANQVGGNDDLLFDGSSFAMAPDGRLLARCQPFAEDMAVFDLPGGGAAPDLPPEGVPDFPPEDVAWVRQALVMGIRDYFHKTGFRRALVGLSGGVDSALVAVLAAEALGPENVKCLSMPSRYSSEHSLTDAAALARNLGVEYAVYPIEDAFAAFLRQFNPGGAALGDLAEENLQARIRGVILMFLSNREGRLVIATGNKSELATGYSTLYGDMCGGLLAIGDVPKTMVYALCRHINAGRPGLIPENILIKPPSAELRPGQKDTDSLPPYEILDPILQAYVEENLTLSQIAARGFDPETVRRVLQMVDRAEYKRRQAAPILRVTSRHFGTGRRMPIAQRWNPGR